MTALRIVPLLLLISSVAFAAAVEVPSPAGTGAAQPHLAAMPDGRLVMSWTEPAKKGSALRFAIFDKGKWATPGTIAERTDFFVNWADFPSIVADENGVLYAHWLQKSGPGTYAYDVHVTTSRDSGKTWTAPRVLHSDGKKAEHGFVSLSPAPGGGVDAIWLDGREMSGEGGHGEHGGDMTLRTARIAADGSISNEQLLDPRVCECCATAIARPKGALIAFYRDRSPEEVRDIGFVRLVDGAWTKPDLVHKDGWKINGCPVNGPQADARGHRVGVAWFTGAEEKPKVRVSFSGNSGKSWTVPMQIDGGSPIGRVDLQLLDDGSAMVTWIEGTGDAANVVTRRVMTGGWTGAIVKIGPTTAARNAGVPRTALVGDSVYYAWNDTATKKIRLARINMK